MKCKNCKAEYQLEEILNTRYSNKLAETIKQRIEAYILFNQEMITGIIHGGFYLIKNSDWISASQGGFVIKCCPVCKTRLEK